LFRGSLREARIPVALGQGFGRLDGQVHAGLAGLREADRLDGPQKGRKEREAGAEEPGDRRDNQGEVQ
jgi:hypothetical protein